MESKDPTSGGQSAQQMQESFVKAELDSTNTLIINSVHNSIDNEKNHQENQADSLIKDGLDEAIMSETESVADDSDASESSIVGVPFTPLQRHDSIDDKLPETVSLLTTPEGGKVYLVGTAHFSEESQNDVSLIIQAVRPNIVMVELCQARVHVLQLDEETVIREAENLNFQTIRATIRQNGLRNGLLYSLLLHMSARMTKQLGMAPGGEFRRAFSEAKKLPGCIVHLGDRPIHITIHRALNALSWWQTLNLFWGLLTTTDPINKEYVENCKRHDILKELLTSLAAEYPPLGEVFVRERDIYLTHSLQLAARPYPTMNGMMPSRVVGIVGIGHKKGIIDNWGKVDPSEIIPLMRVPPPTLSSKIVWSTVKVSLIGAVLYTAYKIIPLPSLSTFQSLKSSVEGLIKVSATR